jgi:hypothetical protein
METMHLDPHTAQDIADLGARLSDATVRNTAGAIRDKVKAIKTNREQRAQIQELEEIIDDLIDDKHELKQIAEAYQEEFVAQQISQEEIEYITQTLIPVLRELVAQTSGDGNNAAANAVSLEKSLDMLESLLSVEMLTVLQLVGFNFKQAVGEPLTLLLQKFILSKVPIDPQSNAEYAKLSMAFNLEVAKIAQDKDATERLGRVMERLRGN